MMSACNGKSCTITKYFFSHYEVVAAEPTDGGPALSGEQARVALEQSESWRSRMVGCGYDPARGTRFAKPEGVPDYVYFTDRNTCADGCTCHMDAPYSPTIRPGSLEQRFEYPGVSHGGKTYTITIKASCILWDYPGTCRPNLVKTALSEVPRHDYYAVIYEGEVPAEPASSGSASRA
ncbi:MAG TPA: hypothetical protein VIL84_11065 [Devosiaceae bacterium]